MSFALLMGIDLGTSSAKTAIIDPTGRLLACATREYGVDTPRPGWAEQAPQVWMQAVVETMGRALGETGVPPAQIAAIGLSGQMHSTVCLDEWGKVQRPAIIWTDQRSREQVADVYEELGRERLGQWTANPLATGFSLASWLWLREHEPQTCRATAHLLLPKDYVRYHLTGELGSEPSDASSTLLFDTARRRWSTALLEALEINPRLLPPIHESVAVAGGLRDEVAGATGLRSGTPVIFGGGDQAMQALGHGLTEPGGMSCTIGTGGQLFAPTTAPTYDRSLRLHLFCHALPERWYLMAATLSAGLSLKWLRDDVFEGKSYHDLAEMASEMPPGAEGLFFLPHLAGERTPHMDPEARGAFVGLTLRHHRGHLARAAMEGVVLALRQGLELMAELGVPVERVIASGGATKHPLWLRLQADILNRPIYQTQTIEAAAVGAALLAGVGARVYPDALTACQRTVRWRDEVIHPIPENVTRYYEAYQVYRQLYPALKNTTRTREHEPTSQAVPGTHSAALASALCRD